MQLKKQIVLGARSQGKQGEAKGWDGAVEEKAKGDFITLSSSLLGWCRGDPKSLVGTAYSLTQEHPI